MNITFISNYYNHHQKEFSENMAKLHGDNYVFIATEAMSKERKNLGYGDWKIPKFVLDISDNDDIKIKRAIQIINSSDIVIVGAVPEYLLSDYIKSGKILFRYSERLFKRRPSLLKFIYRFLIYKNNNIGKHNEYLLCAGGYVANDYARMGVFKKRCFKWGYFPEKKVYEIDELLDNKKKNSILWCGRFIDWKHPEYAIEVAKCLKEQGHQFSLSMIGAGKMEDTLKEMVRKYNLEDCVSFSGPMTPDEVRRRMEQSEIFLFTSNRQEGWGAVLNEAMNSGCVVIASDAIGSVPYLLKNNENGLIFKSEKVSDLLDKVVKTLNNKERRYLGKCAYETIVTEWNGEITAKRFTELSCELLNKGLCDYKFHDGPCSRAD